jgi:hypothetical protein
MLRKVVACCRITTKAVVAVNSDLAASVLADSVAVVVPVDLVAVASKVETVVHVAHSAAKVVGTIVRADEALTAAVAISTEIVDLDPVLRAVVVVKAASKSVPKVLPLVMLTN